jgi:hypothetical protein
MLIVSNGYFQQVFSCHQEVIDVLGQDVFDALMDGVHSQFSMSYIH